MCVEKEMTLYDRNWEFFFLSCPLELEMENWGKLRE